MSGRLYFGKRIPAAAVLLLVCMRLSAREGTTFQVGFTRTVDEGQGIYVTRGVLYYTAPDKVLIQTTSPVRQWSVFTTGETTLYYPDSGKAYRFRNSRGTIVPFAQSFLGLVKDDFGLSDAGFTVSGREMRGENLFTFWKPPKGFEKSYGLITLGIKADKPFFLEAVDPKNRLIFRIVYSGYVPADGVMFPTYVRLELREEGKETVEEIAYTDVKIGEELPPEAENFALPPGVVPKEMTW